MSVLLWRMRPQDAQLVPLDVIRRDWTDGNEIRSATYSPSDKFRYDLLIWWGEKTPRADRMVAFVGLNPSTATEQQDDPTVRRCKNFARDWGFDGMVMLNAFAYRATDPNDMKKQASPVGTWNDLYLQRWTLDVWNVVVAWGSHGTHLGRQTELVDILPAQNLQCLGTNDNGTPKHPLYLAADTKLKPWKPVCPATVERATARAVTQA